MVTIVNNAVSCLKVDKGVNLKNSHHKKKKFLTMYYNRC